MLAQPAVAYNIAVFLQLFSEVKPEEKKRLFSLGYRDGSWNSCFLEPVYVGSICNVHSSDIEILDIGF